MAARELEARVAALEAEVARLKQQVEGTTPPPESWVDKIYGSFANDPDFDKAMELGRKYRESLRPKGAKKKAGKSAKRRGR